MVSLSINSLQFLNAIQNHKLMLITMTATFSYYICCCPQKNSYFSGLYNPLNNAIFPILLPQKILCVLQIFPFLRAAIRFNKIFPTCVTQYTYGQFAEHYFQNIKLLEYVISLACKICPILKTFPSLILHKLCKIVDLDVAPVYYFGNLFVQKLKKLLIVEMVQIKTTLYS